MRRSHRGVRLVRHVKEVMKRRGRETYRAFTLRRLRANRVTRYVHNGSAEHCRGPCWEWAGGHSGTGYPCISYLGRSEYVHRISAHVYKGMRLDDPDKFACHKCDNPKCYNPAHLEPKSPAANNHDCVSRGRWRNRVFTEKDMFALDRVVTRGKSIAGWAAGKGVAYSSAREAYRRWQEGKPINNGDGDVPAADEAIPEPTYDDDIPI